jgi:hypothetical protein
MDGMQRRMRNMGQRSQLIRKVILTMPIVFLYFGTMVLASHQTHHSIAQRRFSTFSTRQRRRNEVGKRRNTYSRRGTARGLAAFGLSSPDTILQVASATISYIGLVGYFDRPRGRLDIEPSHLQVRDSQVTGAGLGLYATESMTKGTVLGTYPGVVVPLQANMEKFRQNPQCETYIWRFTDNERVVDPTNMQTGNLEDVCGGGTLHTPGSTLLFQTLFRAWNVPTTLARINEPPIGMDCNVDSEQDLSKRHVTFFLSRDVVQGEELFMDYGIYYDRSFYGGGGGPSSDSRGDT